VDNGLDQLATAGWKMVMLGDDTWLKLFPDKFMRHDGVNSFYVSLRTCSYFFHLQFLLLATAYFSCFRCIQFSEVVANTDLGTMSSVR